jgi:probable F420-dependent oxidoreductase
MRVGIQLPEAEREVPWPEYRAMARLAEDVGFDTLWLGDHLLYRFPDGSASGPWDVWTMLAAIAASTSRIRLGPLVAATAFHAPAILAKEAATVDEISGGRLILGLGAGWNETEFRAFGFPFDHRVSRFEEAFTIIRTLLREGEIDFAGQFYEARGCELLPRPRPGGPPLLVGSTGPRMLRITLPHVDAWNIWYASIGNRADALEPQLRAVDEICREVGRPASDVERTCAVLVHAPGGAGRATGAEGRTLRPLEGSPETVAAALEAYAARGIAEVQLVVDPITTASIEWLGRVLEVLDRARAVSD